MNRNQTYCVTISGILCGILLSFVYVNPYSGQITVSNLAMQLSGSRGEFALGLSLPELLSFSMRNIPCFLFEMYVGVRLYRHFCTASVYVFSREPNRIFWYAKECGWILLEVVLYQSIILISAIWTAFYRYDVIWDPAGFALVIIHVGLYSLWLFSMTLWVNMFSILCGSEVAFAITIGGQTVLIALLPLLRIFENNFPAFTIAMNVNPIAHLVLGWQSTSVNWLNQAIHSSTNVLLSVSLIYMASIALLTATACGHIVKNKDFIVADSEFGGA